MVTKGVAGEGRWRHRMEGVIDGEKREKGKMMKGEDGGRDRWWWAVRKKG